MSSSKLWCWLESFERSYEGVPLIFSLGEAINELELDDEDKYVEVDDSKVLKLKSALDGLLRNAKSDVSSSLQQEPSSEDSSISHGIVQRHLSSPMNGFSTPLSAMLRILLADMYCSSCFKPLTTPCVEIGSKKFHQQDDCVKCSRCSKALPAPIPVILLDNKPTCQACLPKCGKCNTPITTPHILAGNETFHLECVKCCVCKGGLEDFNQVYRASSGLICPKCISPIFSHPSWSIRRDSMFRPGPNANQKDQDQDQQQQRLRGRDMFGNSFDSDFEIYGSTDYKRDSKLWRKSSLFQSYASSRNSATSYAVVDEEDEEDIDGDAIYVNPDEVPPLRNGVGVGVDVDVDVDVDAGVYAIPNEEVSDDEDERDIYAPIESLYGGDESDVEGDDQKNHQEELQVEFPGDAFPSSSLESSSNRAAIAPFLRPRTRELSSASSVQAYRSRVNHLDPGSTRAKTMYDVQMRKKGDIFERNAKSSNSLDKLVIEDDVDWAEARANCVSPTVEKFHSSKFSTNLHSLSTGVAEFFSLDAVTTSKTGLDCMMACTIANGSMESLLFFLDLRQCMELKEKRETVLAYVLQIFAKYLAPDALLHIPFPISVSGKEGDRHVMAYDQLCAFVQDSSTSLKEVLGDVKSQAGLYLESSILPDFFASLFGAKYLVESMEEKRLEEARHMSRCGVKQEDADIKIPSFQRIGKRHKAYIVYRIEFFGAHGHSTIWRRYSEVRALYDDVKDRFESLALSPFPPKRYISSISARLHELCEARRDAFEKFLQALQRDIRPWTLLSVKLFFSVRAYDLVITNNGK
eukprot:m.93510 g.93510  ORF g.93510 m.93510 type:complete len:805 (+) comp8912_c1_seq3:49-2463(+)